MKGYGQYCPMARAAEVFAERWTPLIVRNLLLGCDTFAALAAAAPGIPRSLLQGRLASLETAGVVARRAKASGRGWRYRLTPAGEELGAVCRALGAWGERWTEVTPRQLDPYLALRGMVTTADRARLPCRRVVVAVAFGGERAGLRRFWLLLEHGAVEVCVHPPDAAEGLLVATDAAALVHWQLGRLTWDAAVGAGRITVAGPVALARAFPTWFPPLLPPPAPPA